MRRKTDLDIGCTDFRKPIFCSNTDCEREFTPGKTLFVADFEAAFPTFCSEECAFEQAQEYKIKHFTDENTGEDFVRLIEIVED